MNSNPDPVDVSVIIPCYNYAHFLPEAVASVIEQTFRAWEIIIVDDGSRDDTLDVARSLIARHPDRRIRLLHQPNQGLSAARNAGARHAAGRYLLYLDADDRLAPTLLERTTAVLRERPSVGFVYTGMYLFGQDQHEWPSTPFDVRVLALDNFVLPHALVRHSAWEQVGGFDTVHFPEGFEDWDFWLRVVAAGWQGWHIPQPLVFYRRHERSMSRSFTPAYEWDARAQIIRKHPAIYGPRLVAWAIVRCARRGLPAATRPAAHTIEAQEIQPPAGASTTTKASASSLASPPARIPIARRLIRKVPFGLRLQLKCLRRRIQLALRAGSPWLFLASER